MTTQKYEFAFHKLPYEFLHVMGRFVQVLNLKHYLYVYEHPNHLMFSKIGFSSIAGLCSVKEEKAYVYECIQHQHHVALLPYFNGNAYLKMVHEHLLSEGHSATCDLLGSLLKEDLFSQDVPGFSHSFDEDTWTERLCRSLNSLGFKCKNTAYLRGKATREAWIKRFPSEISTKCLLFQGAPDIVVQKIKKGKTDGIILCKGGLNADSSDEDERSDSPNSKDSNHSARIQMGLQSCQVKPYVQGSFIPEKAGELVGAIHLSLVSRALRHYKKGKNVTYPLVGHGLQLHKLTGIIH